MAHKVFPAQVPTDDDTVVINCSPPQPPPEPPTPEQLALRDARHRLGELGRKPVLTPAEKDETLLLLARMFGR